ncbi:DUF3626 domain-containing protein [Nocardiopsis exhalans]|uniref:DUF3626 domain-containing protein n=1 Tax=Nocardiopsis exhalans TaxID=163604 RepID=A0ABY5CZ58_9ACTN|nr:DUF3626 domain-containing protein [Nocardiopsis exhalans]USY17132.1 DUF3626 domain-containing protein [Nocardiopsis exhalans]
MHELRAHGCGCGGGCDGARGQLAAQRALEWVRERSWGGGFESGWSVTLNFHPDRWAGGRTVVERMALEGVYRSQFVTGTSNGGLTAFEGGDRWRWESRMFGGAYDRAPVCSRPVYGALDWADSQVGAAPRFGSCFFRLGPQVAQRSTFCYPDSTFEPCDFGVGERMGLVELARGSVNGGAGRDVLDEYVEAQVHGPVRWGVDVAELVLDPSFRGTAVEEAARGLGCALSWHGGFRLSVGELRRHPAYRGREFVELGERLAVGGWLTPKVVGDAARSGEWEPQSLKRVWHYVARFGAPW